MKYVKLFEQFVAEQDAICEATVMMDALDPHSRDLKKLLKKHNVQMEIGVSGGPGASMGAGTEVTLTGKRSDLEKVLADPMGWDDPDLAEYIEESKSINESYYIETWYLDKNGKEVQLLGSDGTSVFSRLPRTTDIKKHLDHINSLKKIKPSLAGGVIYKVVDRNGKVYMTGDEAQWQHQIGEHNVTKGPKSLNEAKGDKITIRWSGFSALGADEGRIGTFIVSPKVHSQIEDEFGSKISIDFEDDNVNGKLASFEDVLTAMKQSKYGKIAFK